jgi:hypothetical protein
MIKHFRKYIALKSDHRRMLFEAVLFLFLAKFLLAILPVKIVMNITLSGKTKEREPDKEIFHKIKWALFNADRISFRKNTCLVQSIAGRFMLQRRGIVSKLSLGVRHDKNKKMIAHAWLKTDDFEIVEKSEDYLELYTF